MKECCPLHCIDIFEILTFIMVPSFLGACARQFPKIIEKEIDACIGETLKHAPHRAKVVITPVSCFIH